MRKNNFFIATLALVFATALSAKDLRVPSSVFTMDKLEEATTKSIEENKPLIFVYTDPGTT